MNSQVTNNKRKKKSGRLHPYSSLYKEVRAAWKKNPGVVKNMIQDMVEKKGRVLERPFLLEFVERFLEIHREPLHNYNWELWDDVLRWATRQKVQYIVDVFGTVLKKLDTLSDTGFSLQFGVYNS